MRQSVADYEENMAIFSALLGGTPFFLFTRHTKKKPTPLPIDNSNNRVSIITWDLLSPPQ